MPPDKPVQQTTDLRPWGWAPGGYSIRCMDCPPRVPYTPITRDTPTGDKRCWRCEPHAKQARDSAEWEAAQPPMICDIDAPHA